MARELPSQVFDIVVPTRLALQLRETTRELSSQWAVCGCEESLSFRRKDNLKHPTGPSAN
jgi:hypothetical protein